MLNWDAAPAGPYGYREDVHYALGGYHRVYRWRPALGTGTLNGVVTDNGAAVVGAPVVLEGWDIGTFTEPDGSYLMQGVPMGPATVRSCSGSRGDEAFANLGALTTVNLAFADGCPEGADPGAWRRAVRIHGTVKLVDTEDFGSDEIETFPLDITLNVEPATDANPDTAEAFSDEFVRCTGGEVKTKIRFRVRLTHDRRIELQTDARLFEGQSCQDNDLDGSKEKNTVIAEDDTESVSFVINSEEFGGSDSMTVTLQVENNISPN
jgi:hypothetical protein